MPNSTLVMKAKNDMLIAIQNDEQIIEALDIHDDEDIENLIAGTDIENILKKRLFPYWFVPATQEAVKTYICIEADVESFEKRYSSATDYKTYDIVTITIDILCHQNDIYMNKAGVSAIRPDYLSCLIDKKFNGSNDFGIGRLQRISNKAYSLKDNIYRYRQLVFRATDLNNCICGDC